MMSSIRSLLFFNHVHFAYLANSRYTDSPPTATTRTIQASGTSCFNAIAPSVVTSLSPSTTTTLSLGRHPSCFNPQSVILLQLVRSNLSRCSPRRDWVRTSSQASSTASLQVTRGSSERKGALSKKVGRLVRVSWPVWPILRKRESSSSSERLCTWGSVWGRWVTSLSIHKSCNEHMLFSIIDHH